VLALVIGLRRSGGADLDDQVVRGWCREAQLPRSAELRLTRLGVSLVAKTGTGYLALGGQSESCGMAVRVRPHNTA
jgi:hypothetical protein